MRVIVPGKRRYRAGDGSTEGERDGNGTGQLALRTRDHGGTIRNQWTREIYCCTSVD